MEKHIVLVSDSFSVQKRDLCHGFIKCIEGVEA